MAKVMYKTTLKSRVNIKYEYSNITHISKKQLTTYELHKFNRFPTMHIKNRSKPIIPTYTKLLYITGFYKQTT